MCGRRARKSARRRYFALGSAMMESLRGFEPALVVVVVVVVVVVGVVVVVVVVAAAVVTSAATAITLLGNPIAHVNCDFTMYLQGWLKQ